MRERLRVAGNDRVHILLHIAKQPRIANHASLDRLLQSSAQLRRWQRAEKIRVGQHSLRMIKTADQILSRNQIRPGLPPDRRIHLRQQRRRHLHVADAAHINRRKKSGKVANHPAAKSDQQRIAIRTRNSHLLRERFHTAHPLVRLARRQKKYRRRLLERGEKLLRPQRPDVRRGHDKRPKRLALIELHQSRPKRAQKARSDSDIVGGGGRVD